MTQMQRRDFLKSTVAVAVAAELGIGKAQAKVPAHNWGNYDFGCGPQVTDRLNQGPFPQYPPDAVIPTDDVVMTTTSRTRTSPLVRKKVRRILVLKLLFDDENRSEHVHPCGSDLRRAGSSRILQRAQLNRWRHLHPAPPVVRYEHPAPGDLLHLDIKGMTRYQQVSIRGDGRRRGRPRFAGWQALHVAIDDHSRLAFSRM